MSAHERKERIAYFKFKIKAMGLAALFIHMLKKDLIKSDLRALTKQRMRVIYEDEDDKVEVNSSSIDATQIIKWFWHSLTGVMLWFNLITSPSLILWPEL